MKGNLLVDTQILLWFAEGNSRIPYQWQIALNPVRNNIFYSYVSLWEIAIKTSLNKLPLANGYDEFIRRIDDSEWQVVQPTKAELDCLLTLPFHHRDPFDRMIIAQAILHSYTVVTTDEKFVHYPVALLP